MPRGGGYHPPFSEQIKGGSKEDINKMVDYATDFAKSLESLANDNKWVGIANYIRRFERRKVDQTFQLLNQEQKDRMLQQVRKAKELFIQRDKSVDLKHLTEQEVLAGFDEIIQKLST